MPHTVSLDDDVFSCLQELAEPLVDDINSVLRKLLGSAITSTARTTSGENETKPAYQARKKRARKQGSASTRAPKGSLVSEDRYELPILAALERLGGRAPSSEILEVVGKALSEELGPIDREVLKSGLPRWKSRAQFVRLALVKSGDMAGDSPRGTWEISQQGRDRLASASDD